MRWMQAVWGSRVVISLAAVAAGSMPALLPDESGEKAKSGQGRVLPAIVAAPAPQPVAAPRPGPNGFTPQLRLGFTVGDQWEPAVAADDYGSVYVLYPQYGGVPGCPAAVCASPTAILQVSRDRGATWDAPRPAAPSGSEQVDTQIVVDPVDGKTLYAAWLQNSKSDIVVARSNDLGASWSTVVADHTNAGTDKPILAVRGPHVYVAYNHSQTVLVSSSHDGGATFTSTKVNPNAKLGWSLAGGGTVTPDGSVYFGWSGYHQNGQAKGPVDLYVSKSSDGGATWTNQVLDVSASPPDCSAYFCGWAYLGAQLTLASDEAGTLYAMWNAGSVDKGPERIFFSRSEDGGATWSPRADVSRAPAGAAHAFPAVAAGAPGDVRISWMDARNGPLWNVYYRRSGDGGRSFTAEADLSTYVAGFSYIQPAGFGFPFGDYYEIAIDDRGDSQLIWGEGLNWDSPGSIWYARGR
jgi:BNR repeat-like domain